MRKLIFGVVMFITSTFIFAQNDNKKQKDVTAIKEMCGCFKVTFNFKETFEYSKDSLYKPSKEKHESAVEWAHLIKDEKDELSIQHILVVGPPTKPHIVKHWRQDWLFENPDIYEYNADNVWTYKNKTDVTGQWTQKVYQVDDSPRYEGSATWVHVDGRSFWENTTPAPLARREYTQRSDYNVLERGNHIEVKEYGWLHEQDNKKIIRKANKEDVVLAEEKGYNTYEKIDDTQCKAAADWWKENKILWKNTRKIWADVYGRKKTLKLHDKVDYKPLYKHLFKLEPDTRKKEIRKIIEKYVVE